MQLNLNNKEWLVLLAHMERTAPSYAEEDQGVLNRVRSRLRSVMEDALRDHEVSLAGRWLDSQSNQVKALEEDTKAVRRQTRETAQLAKVLTVDDEDEDMTQGRAYPRKPPKMPKPGRKGRKRR